MQLDDMVRGTDVPHCHRILVVTRLVHYSFEIRQEADGGLNPRFLFVGERGRGVPYGVQRFPESSVPIR